MCLQDRDSYWKMMHKYIGSDVTSMVTLPVLIFEPMSMLQKMAEVCFLCQLQLVFTLASCPLLIRGVSTTVDGILVPFRPGR